MSQFYSRVTSEDGVLQAGPLRISWGNPIGEYDLAGFCCISWNRWSLEFGDIDQGRPGIYITECVDGDVVHHRTLLQFA